ncbi:MAG: hypothetical protein U0L76_00360 [Ruminococcus sp.]|nr:hypothetical protein [Ruminococcus sp.]
MENYDILATFLQYDTAVTIYEANNLTQKERINVTVKKCSSYQYIDLTVGHETFDIQKTFCPKLKELGTKRLIYKKTFCPKLKELGTKRLMYKKTVCPKLKDL